MTDEPLPDIEDEEVEALFAALDALEGHERYSNLIAWARSSAFSGAGLIPCSWMGPKYADMVRINREAFGLLRAALDKETPGKAWHAAWNPADRKVICRHLKIDPADPLAFFATFPFRVIRNEGERPWIAAAIGCRRIMDPASKEHAPGYDWLHIDIDDVILWNPRSGEVKVAGDPDRRLVECANYDDGRYTVFADPFSFFRAWADRRAEFGARVKAARASKHVLISTEAVDNCMPGALVIGDLDRVHWRDLDAAVLVAGPGVDPVKLNRAIFRTARLPRVEAA